MDIRFAWDTAKAASNVRKHGISFEIATRVFADPFSIAVQDRVENGEDRWQTLGMVEGYLLLIVAHTVRDDDGGAEIIRIISARRADSTERKRYEKNCSF